VRLELPETGVCSSDFVVDGDNRVTGDGCCGTGGLLTLPLVQVGATEDSGGCCG
jgi:hypothetical protein